MSVNRILKKRRQGAQNTQDGPVNYQQTSQQGVNEQSQRTAFEQPRTTNQPRNNQHDKKMEEQYEKYAQYAQYNPSTYMYSNSYLPCNASLYKKFNIPVSIMVPPVSYEMDPVERSIDKIPRCGSCRAYMNYYNEIKKKSFVCFLCGRENGLMGDYVVDAQNVQLNHPSYHVLGGQNVYHQAPPENAMIFLVDLNNSSFQSKMLYYFVSVMKEVLSREDLDEVQIYFFTYDDVVHEYDFSGEEVKCTVFDPSIAKAQTRPQQNFLGKIREKLFELLDSLQQIAEQNKKQGSNFFNVFGYVLQAVKHTGGKIFVFQCNEAITGEPFDNEYQNKNNAQGDKRSKSFLDSKNKSFFQTYINCFLDNSISASFFIFQRAYKNIRVFGDFAKLSNSQLKLYRKDSVEDLMKFYYDFYYLLGAVYYKDVRIELMTSPGWYFTAIYGNLFRIKQFISFKFCHLQPSTRISVHILPQETSQLPYCCLQLITNYIYNRQHFVCVNTVVLPLTMSLEKLYLYQDYTLASVSQIKVFLSHLRLQQINIYRNKMLRMMSDIWKSANDFYKKKVPPQITNLMLSFLGFLKSPHAQLDAINDTIVLDTVVAQRNWLQSMGVADVANCFCPYLFNLSTMTEEMCRDEENFVYPQACQLKFSSVKDGVFLLDNGLSLYLYISKGCHPEFLKMLFGKQKIMKNEHLTEQNLLQDNLFAQQVALLIRVLREQKAYGWIPLYVVRCGEGTLNEKLFYLNFYAQKYDEFRSFKMTLNQFLHQLSQHH